MIDPEVEQVPFGKKIAKFLKEGDHMVKSCFEQQEGVTKQYHTLLDYFMICKGQPEPFSEMVDDSGKFFTFIMKFVDDVDGAMPKALIKQDTMAKKRMSKNLNIKDAAKSVMK